MSIGVFIHKIAFHKRYLFKNANGIKDICNCTTVDFKVK